MRAVELFEKAIELARNEEAMINVIFFRNLCKLTNSVS
jgi:hypothetical protein